MNISTILRSAILLSVAAVGLSTKVAAQNPAFAPGDLVVAVQSTGSGNDKFVMVGLGSAAQYRDASSNRPGIANIGPALTAQFGAGWAERSDLYIGAIGIWGADAFDESLLNEDPTYTLYVSAARTVAGTAGAAQSQPYFLTELSLGGAGDEAIGVVRDFEQRGTAAISTLSNADSFLDWMDRNPISGGVQQTAFGAFPAGIQSVFGPGSFGNLGGGAVEAAIDLYRIQMFNGIPGQYGFGDDIGVGRYLGTITINSSGSVSFLALANLTPPSISTSSLSGATVGTTYSRTLAATGGTTPYSWSLDSGTLPEGLNLSSSGTISGTPTEPGTFAFTVKVTDASALSDTASLSISVTAPAVAPTITTSSLPDGTDGTAYSQTLVASGGDTPYTWSISTGALPTGLSLNSATGRISGTPTAGGTFNFTVRVTGSDSLSSTKSLSIVISDAPVISTPSIPAGVVGSSYSLTLAATGGATPYSWSIASGSLPPGLTLNSAGIISGTPGAAGSFTFAARVTGSDSLFSTKAYTIVIAGPPAISTSSLPAATVGVAYSQDLAATGGATPYSWSVASGTLPTGLNLASSGRISGTPTAAGSFTFSVRVTGSNTLSSTRSFSIVAASAPVITTTDLADGVRETAYSQTFAATGGAAPHTWSVATGTLPAGLSLSAGGVLSGTPTAAGTTIFTIRVTGADSLSSTRSFSVTVAAPPDISTSSLPAAVTGVSYSQTLSATGGKTPYVWSLSSGAIPTGLVLSTSGVISGTPTSSASQTFTIQVTGADSLFSTKQFTISVSQPPSITTAALASGTPNTAYTQTLTATGGVPPYNWTIASGSLPTGLSLSASGVVSGTPTVAGTSSLTIRATGSDNLSSTKAFSLLISSQPTAPTITTGTLPNGRVGTAYSKQIEAIGGLSPYTWSIASGALPAGIALSSTGALSGTPSGIGVSNFTVKVTGKNGLSATQTLALTVSSIPTITTLSMAGGVVGEQYFQELGVSGGLSPHSWSVAAGSLPAGLILESTGVISGTPTKATTSRFTIQVAGHDELSSRKSFSISIAAAPVISTTSLLGATLATTYRQVLSASGGTTPYTWSITAGALPTGMTLSAGGVIGGTPTQAGEFSLTIKVTGGNGLASTANFNLLVSAPPTITTSALNSATVGIAFSQTLAATGGSKPYQWALSLGALPVGLSLSQKGVLQGVPTVAETKTITVQVRGNDGLSSTRSFVITSNAPISVTTATLPSAIVGAPYSATLESSGGLSPFTWSLASGRLPAGLQISSNGTITGIPTRAGNSTFGLKVTGADKRFATKTLTISVLTAPTITTTSLPIAVQGRSYSNQLHASGGVSPYTWRVSSGRLPAGLSLSALGLINGTPTSVGTSSVTFQVEGADGASSTKAFPLVVKSAPTITSESIQNAVVGVAYSQRLTATGGTTPYAWSVVSGSLPSGFSLNSAGVISGTTVQAGTLTFTVRCLGADGIFSTKLLTLPLTEKPTISTVSLPGGVVGAPYSQMLTATGGSTPYSWALISGSLPRGLVINSAGLISGTPTVAGSNSFTVRVTTGDSLTASMNLVIVVEAADVSPPEVSFGALPPANARLTSANTTFTGLVSDNGGKPNVQMRVYTSSPLAAVWRTIPATNATTPYAWTANVTLSPGPNTIEVRAIDRAGNASLPVARLVNYVVTAPLKVTAPAVTDGTITPGFAGTTNRELGVGYTIEATPAWGKVFKEWKRNGVTYSRSASLRFIMTSGLELVPSFAASGSAFPAGSFAGLVGSGDVGDGTNADMQNFRANNGSIDLTTTTGGGFLGSLSIEGKTLPFNGSFNGYSQAKSIITRSGQPNAIITMTMKPGTAPFIVGVVSTGGAPMDFVLLPSSYSGSVTDKHPLAGSTWNVILAASSVKVGHGFLTIQVQDNGTAQMEGYLGDGTAIKQSLKVADDGHGKWVIGLHIPAYASNSGLLWGDLSISKTSLPAAPAITGEFAWLKPANASFTDAKTGFLEAISAVGERARLGTGISAITNTATSGAFRITWDARAKILSGYALYAPWRGFHTA